MADLLIKGMEMPQEEDLMVVIGTDGSITSTGYGKWEAVEIPPHGRLVDTDVLMREYEKAQKMMEADGQEYSCSFLSPGLEISTEWYCVEDMLDSAPTVIEASE